MQKDPPKCHVNLRIVVEDLFHWQAIIIGPPDTPYAGGVFRVNVHFPDAYPFRHPEVTFRTMIVHPNIDYHNGFIKLNAVASWSWSALSRTSKVLLSLSELMSHPNFSDPVLPEVSKLYSTDPAEYDKIARLWTQTLATGEATDPETDPEAIGHRIWMHEDSNVEAELEKIARIYAKKFSAGESSNAGTDPEQEAQFEVELSVRLNLQDLKPDPDSLSLESSSEPQSMPFLKGNAGRTKRSVEVSQEIASASMPFLMWDAEGIKRSVEASQKTASEQYITASKRLLRELEDMQKDPPKCHVNLRIVVEDLFHWQAIIIGPPDTPYAGGVFRVNIHFPDAYPFRHPEVTFRTMIVHPNIDFHNGFVKLNALVNWSPLSTTSKVLLSLFELMSHPNLSDPALLEVAKLYSTDPAEYDKKARLWTQALATGEATDPETDPGANGRRIWMHEDSDVEAELEKISRICAMEFSAGESSNAGTDPEQEAQFEVELSVRSNLQDPKPDPDSLPLEPSSELEASDGLNLGGSPEPEAEPEDGDLKVSMP